MEIKLKKVRQSESFCGPASLVSLLDYYGVDMSEKELGVLCGTTVALGTEPEDLVRVLEDLSFQVKVKTHGTWEELKDLVTHGTPVLVDWWSEYFPPAGGHYSLVYKMTDKSIFLMDPELGGYRRVSKDRFMCNWYDFYEDTGEKNYRWYLYISK